MTQRPASQNDAHTDEAFAYIQSYAKQNGYAPSLSEIAEHFADRKPGGYSKTWAHSIVAELKRQGRIKVYAGAWRGIEIVKLPAGKKRR